MNNTQKHNRKGFTLLELTIVIAVIGILAAVIVPRFSTIVSNSDLRSDKQLVDQLNLALQGASDMYGTPESVEQAMLILEQSGYSSSITLSSDDVTAYWFSTFNSIVLVRNDSDGNPEIIYPEDCKTEAGTTAKLLENSQLQTYNTNKGYSAEYLKLKIFLNLVPTSGNTTYNAQYINTSTDDADQDKDLTSSNLLVVEKTQVTVGGSDDKTYLVNTLKITSDTNSASAQKSLNSIITGSSSTADLIVIAAGIEGVSQPTGSESYAKIQAYYLAPNFNSTYIKASTQSGTSDDTIKCEPREGYSGPNLIYIDVHEADGDTTENISAVRKAAGRYLYQIFSDINAGNVDPSVNIVFSDGAIIDLSGMEWAFVKAKTGYMGSRNPNSPAIITGLQLSSATKAADTLNFALNGSQYYVSGFIGSLYGNATLENITFQNCEINEPASDVGARDMASGVNYANATGLIGMVTDINYIGAIQTSYDEETKESTTTVNIENATTTSAAVTISNVTVENSCTVTGTGIAGGLIGYVGSAKVSGEDGLAGSLTITGCTVSASVNSTDYLSDYDMGSAGGFIGKMDNFLQNSTDNTKTFDLSFETLQYTVTTGTAESQSVTKSNYFMGSTSGFRTTAGFIGYVNGIFDLNKIDASCTVTEQQPVEVQATGIKLSLLQNQNNVQNGEESSSQTDNTVVATISPSNATNREVTWSCDNSAVTFAENGNSITVPAATSGAITVTTVNGKTSSLTIDNQNNESSVTLTLSVSEATGLEGNTVTVVTASAAIDRKHSASCTADFAVFGANGLAMATTTNNNSTVYVVNKNSISPYSFSEYLASGNIIGIIDSDGNTCGFSNYGPLYSAEDGAKATFDAANYSVVGLSSENKLVKSDQLGSSCQAGTGASASDYCFYNTTTSGDSTIISEILAIQVWQ